MFRKSNMALSVIIITVLIIITGSSYARSGDIQPGGTDQFQYQIITNNDYAVVGAEWHDAFKGAAYIFKRNGDSWSEPQKLSPPDLGQYDHFGSSVSIYGDYAAVGTMWQDNFKGAVYIFKNVNGEWIFQQKLTAADARPDDHFGYTIKIDGNEIIVSNASDLVYKFLLTDGVWAEQEKLNASELALGESDSDDSGLSAATGNDLTELIDQIDVGPPPEPLYAPQDSLWFWVQATDALYENRVEIIWMDAELDAIIYKILRNDTLLSVASSQDTLYMDFTSTPGDICNYCVAVVNMAETILDSACDPGSRIIFPPIEVSASDGEFDSFVRVTWTDMSAVETGFYVTRNDVTIDSTAAGMTLFDDTTATPEVTYNYAVMAFDSEHNLSTAEADYGWRGAIMPPGDVSASDGEYDEYVKITWDDQAQNEQGYIVYRDNSLIATTDADAESFEDSAAAFGTTYDYCIRTLSTGSETPPDSAGSYDLPGTAFSVAVAGNYAYVTDYEREPSALYVVDIQDPANPDSVGTCPLIDHAQDVAVSGNYAYVANDNDGLRVIDISDPAHPAETGHCDVLNQALGVALKGHYAYVAADEAGLVVVDIGDPVNPEFVARRDTPGKAYGVAVSGDYAVVADYDSGVYVIDISNPLNPIEEGNYATVGARDVAVSGRHAFISNTTGKLLQVIDISDPASPDSIGACALPAHAYGITISGIYAYVADSESGLTVVNVIDPTAPYIVGSCDTPGRAMGVATCGDYAYVADHSSGLHVLNLGERIYASTPICDEGGVGILPAPAHVNASDSTFDDRIEISWDDPSGLEDGFIIQRDDSTLTTTGKNVTAYTDKTADADVPHEYCVSAFSNNGGNSEQVCDTGFQMIVLAPFDVNATDGDYEDHVEITWKSNSTTAVLYKILRDGTLIKSVSQGARAHSDYGGTAGQVYEYSVVAVTALNDESAADSDNGKRKLLAPDKLKASYEEYEDKIEVSWTDNSQIEDGYIITRDGSPLDTIGSDRTWIIDSTAVPGITYTYGVAAFDTLGEALGKSEEVTDEGRRILFAPSNVQATDDTYEDRVEITWSDNSNAEDGYRIYQVYQDDTVIVETGSNTTSHTDWNPIFGQASEYSVIAFDAYGESEADSDFGSTTILPPLSVNASDTYLDRIELTWVDQSEIETGYEILRDSIPIATLNKNENTYTDIPFSTDSTYKYCVGALLNSGQMDYVGGCAMTDYTWSVAVAGNYAYLADGAGGLQVVDISDLTNPYITGWCPTDDQARYVVIDGKYAYVADHTSGLQVVDISDPTNPTIVGHRDTPGAAYHVDVNGHYAYVAEQAGGLQIIDISNPTNPVIMGGYPTDAATWRVVVNGDYAYVADGVSGLRVLDIHNPISPIAKDSFPGINAIGLAVCGDYAYVCDYTGDSMMVIDISNPDALMAIGKCPTPGIQPVCVTTAGDYAYIGGGYGIMVVDISDPDNPIGLESDLVSTVARTVVTKGDHAFVAHSGLGLRVLNIGASSTQGCDNGQCQEPPPGSEEVWVDLKLLASDGEAGDGFGRAVSISGDYAIVGAPYENDSVGAAYIFERATNGKWLQKKKLMGEGERDFFGWSVSISGDYAIVGMTNTVWATGRAHIFKRSASGNWSEDTVLTSSPLQHWDRFGCSVAIDGNYALMGASAANIDGIAECGAAYLFERSDSGTWHYTQRLTSSNKKVSAWFGSSVAISGGYAIVGCTGEMYETGLAYIFEQDANGSWPEHETQMIWASDHAEYDHFGHSVAISGDVAVVGAPDADVGDSIDAGEAYVFERQGGVWTQIKSWKGYQTDEYRGQSVAISGDNIVIGRPGWGTNDYGKLEVYDRARNYAYTSIRLRGHSAGDSLGFSVAISGDDVIFGAPGDDDNGASAGAVGLLSSTVSATDGTLDSRVRISWQDCLSDELGYRIYRNDGKEWEVGKDIESFEDFDAQPGMTYEYCVEAYDGLGSEYLRLCDFGWRPPDGNITGRVSTAAGAGTESVSVGLNPQPTRSLLLDGNGGYAKISDPDPLYNFDGSESFTVELWLKYTGEGGEGDRNAIIIGKGGHQYNYEPFPFCLSNRRAHGYPERLQFQICDGDSTYYPITSSGCVNNDGEWHHVACVHNAESKKLILYVDGSHTEVTYPVLGNTSNSEDLHFGGGYDDRRWFGGQIDEVRIWNVARDSAQIAATSHQLFTGEDDEHLIAYWPLDEGSPGVITDMTDGNYYGTLEGGAHWCEDAPPMLLGAPTDLQGNYVLNNIRYGKETTFEVRPYKGDRQFSPAFKTITLSTGNPVENQVNFVDISSYTVTGKVEFADYECPVTNVKIHVNGDMKTVTDKNGNFSVAIAEGEHTIQPVLEGRTFGPASLTLTVNDNVSGLVFTDMTTRTFGGHVGGGCGRYVGDVDIIIRSENNCLNRTLTVTDSAYSITLPPQRYLVRGVVDEGLIPDGLNKTDVKNFFTRLGEREVDLSGEDDSLVLDFVYRAPLYVTITGLENYIDSTCILIYGDRTLPANLPVIAQWTVIDLVIEVNEFYGYDQYDEPIYCPLDSGIVVIYDEIFGLEDSLIIIEVKEGEAVYTTFVNVPSLMVGRLDSEGKDRSFQKAIRATARVEGREPKTAEEWVLVTGHVAPPGSDFITATSSEIPIYILRDPPGDYTYSFLEEGYSLRTTMKWGDTITTSQRGNKFHVRYGLDTELGFGLAVTKSIPIQAMQGYNWQSFSGNMVHKVDKTEVTLTASERYSTSSDELFVGEAGDVFIGLGWNFIFSEVSVIEVEDCEVVRSTSLGFQPDSIQTTFAYTHQYINDVLIEDLKAKEEHYNSLDDSISARTYHVRWQNWDAMLEYNDSLKKESTKHKNLSFSAGADYAYFYESDTTKSHTFTNMSIVDTSHEFTGLQAKFSGFEFIFSHPWSCHTEELIDFADTTFDTTQAVGFVFNDNNIGDHFTVDIKYDSIYPSPIFDVLAGVSSCPYEPWPDPETDSARMMGRDSVRLYMDTPEDDLLGLQPGEPAVIQLTMYNASPTQDTRIYELREVSTTNPYGATISANGVWLYEGIIYYIDGDTSNNTQTITMTVERGPTKYYYEDLAVMAYPQCEWDIWERRTGGPLNHSDTLWFTVSWEAPCSDITLSYPESGWIFNKADQVPDSAIEITLTDYELYIGSDTLTSVGAQYRRLGTGQQGPTPWTEIERTDPDTLEPPETIIEWHPLFESLPDGVYELRGFAECDDGGRGFSSVATGTIDQHAPMVFGTPEPSDGELSFGENISITFNEPINCGSIDMDSITLTYLSGSDSGSTIPIETVCDGQTIIITPADSIDADSLEGQVLEAYVAGIRDLVGNPMEDDTAWSFDVRQSVFTWSQMDLHAEVVYRNPGVITAELVNGKRTPVYFEIDPLVAYAWIIDVFPDTGTLDPGETQTISFTIQEDIPMGSHTTSVVAESSEPDARLDIYLDVVCQKPEWSINPNQYEYSMTIVAQLEIDGMISTDSEDMLAAFVGNQLRGYAKLEPIMGRSYAAFLTIYSNRVSGETVRFQVWDDDVCKLYNNTVELPYTFVADTHFGSPSAPETFTASDEFPEGMQIIPVSEGWNWFSLNLYNEDMSLDNILSYLAATDADNIKSQDAYAQYDPGLGWIGSLQLLDNLSCYMIKLSESGDIYLEGSFVDPPNTPIPVSTGWNWISYLPQESLTVDSALADLVKGLETDDMIKSQSEFASYVIGSGWYGNLNSMSAGNGYKIYLEKGDQILEFRYPGGSSINAAPMARIQNQNAINTQTETGWSVDCNAYQYNMTMTGVLKIEDNECRHGNIVIGAFVDGECRGIAEPTHVPGIDRYEVFLMIYSNEVSGEIVDFQAFIPDKRAVYNVAEVINYEANAALGTVREPLIINAKEIAYEITETVPTDYSLSQNYPNPFNPMTVISYSLQESGDVELIVYNMLGQKVRTLVSEFVKTGHHKAVWDGLDEDGQPVSTGIYLYRLKSGNFSKTMKMALIK